MSASGSVHSSEVRELEQAYASALEEYVSTGGEDALRSAYELGCSTHCRCRAGAPMKNLSHSASFWPSEKYAPSNSGTKQLSSDQRLLARS